MWNKLILTLLFISILSLATIAQTGRNHGLILRGTAYDRKVTRHKSHLTFATKLRMEFVNKGTKSVIIINPFTDYGAWKSKVTFYRKGFEYKEGNSIEKEYVYGKSIKTSDVKSQRIEELTEGLKSETPPQNLVTIIDPGESIQFDDNLVVNQKITLKKDKYGIDEIKLYEGPECKSDYGDYYPCNRRFSKYEHFKLLYSINVVKYNNKTKFYESLKEKWQSYGRFLIDSSGSFSIASEPIKISR